MRVFISWSGARSHAVAIALKNFIGDIIQSVVPFVSDEDIVSGERWASRLQDELNENQFGILSITNDNKGAPWVLFEAGALSSHPHHIPVVPFLFQIEPSELTGSPLLQFQAVYYNKENARKLVNDINNACGDGKLDATRLDRAFERVYNEFDTALKAVEPEPDKPDEAKFDTTRIILEELLDLTRNNQKIFGNTEMQGSKVLGQVETLLERLDMSIDKNRDLQRLRRKGKYSPMMFEEFLHFSRHESTWSYGILVILSFYRDELPWLYDAGRDLLSALKNGLSYGNRERAIREFRDLIEFSFYNPEFSFIWDKKEEQMMVRNMPMILNEYLDQLEKDDYGETLSISNRRKSSDDD